MSSHTTCRGCGKRIERHAPRSRLNFSDVTYKHIRDEYRPNGWAVKQKVVAKATATYCPGCAARVENAIRKELGL